MTDIELDIATAHSRMAKQWKNKKVKWSDLVKRCKEPTITNETAAEYAKMTREEQSNIKDVGGFVGGYLSAGVRKSSNVLFRSCVTLDIDFGNSDVWEDFALNYNFTALMYSTHKHTDKSPRLRLVFPLSRRVTVGEYEPLCRKIASNLGMDIFDDTTYEFCRLFYWPSTPKDVKFVFEYQDGPICDVDSILSEYVDYKDAASWPVSSRQSEIIQHNMRHAGDPTDKKGLIGLFCRAYTIEDAIDTFLSDEYEKTAHEGRYTYKKGSVSGGLVCYEHKFAYSNHDTDPASRQLCNAFDLVRIHKFGPLDERTRTEDITKMESYKRMMDFISEDKKSKILLYEEGREKAKHDFDGIEVSDGDEADDSNEPEDTSWVVSLEMDGKKGYKSTAMNFLTILQHDRKLKGHLFRDLFSGFDIVKGGLPWNKKAEQWGNLDDANLRMYIEKNYMGLSGKDKLMDAKAVVLNDNSIHPIREYLNSLHWDGVERLDGLIIDYVGAEDIPLNRAFTRKHFCAAVARVMIPGCKYDYCLILKGPEGMQKSTFFSVMGGKWFSDSVISTDGKNGMEQLRCGWIIELSELSSIKRSEVENIKAYITRRDDIYRAAYGTTVERHPRQCVFCGTTNEDYFLKGETGNRRFWVIEVDGSKRKYDIDRLALDRDQIWAEAVYRYKNGEKLYLDEDLEKEAKIVQAKYGDEGDDPMREMVESFLATQIPSDWKQWSLQRRRAYYSSPEMVALDKMEDREFACAAEFVCERLGMDMKDQNYRYMSRKFGKIMKEQTEWGKPSASRREYVLYGVQKTYKKNTNSDDDTDDDTDDD